MVLLRFQSIKLELTLQQGRGVFRAEALKEEQRGRRSLFGGNKRERGNKRDRRELTCFRFFGQLILLFWTAGGELSDVEEQFREAR
jgi:hypothetical protein